jgi:hypothetical protein
MLRRLACTDNEHAETLRNLADRIDPHVTKHPETPASSRYMRRQRIRVISAVWKLVYEA